MKLNITRKSSFSPISFHFSLYVAPCSKRQTDIALSIVYISLKCSIVGSPGCTARNMIVFKCRSRPQATSETPEHTYSLTASSQMSSFRLGYIAFNFHFHCDSSSRRECGEREAHHHQARWRARTESMGGRINETII